MVAGIATLAINRLALTQWPARTWHRQRNDP